MNNTFIQSSKYSEKKWYKPKLNKCTGCLTKKYHNAKISIFNTYEPKQIKLPVNQRITGIYLL